MVKVRQLAGKFFYSVSLLVAEWNVEESEHLSTLVGTYGVSFSTRTSKIDINVAEMERGEFEFRVVEFDCERRDKARQSFQRRKLKRQL